MKNNQLAVCILVKYPIEGNVKTRLAKSIGEKQAVILYKKLLVNTVYQVSMTSAPNDIFLVSSDIKHKSLLNSFFKKKFNLVFYSELKLNLLLKRIFFDFLIKKKYNKVLVMCSDSPFITPKLIDEVYNILLNEPKTLFISPSSDGGYSLIGLNKFVDIFSTITMSTSSVLKKTLLLARLTHLNKYLSNVVDDIDTKEDIYKSLSILNNNYDPKGIIRKQFNYILKLFVNKR